MMQTTLKSGMKSPVSLAVAATLALGGSALAMPSAHAQNVDGLIADYTFDQASGSEISDASGAGNDAMLVGTENWNGGYLELDGTNHVELPDDVLANQDAATIIVETMPTRLSGARFLWNIGGSGDDATGQFFIKPADARLTISATNYSAEQTAKSDTPLEQNQWSAIAATIALNDDGETSTLQLWVNGELAAEKTDSQTNLRDLTDQTMNYLGKSAYRGDALYEGWVSSFQIYDQALTGEQIAALEAESGAAAAEATLAAIDLADHNDRDLQAITDDLTLPTAGAVTWQAEPDLIDSDGKLAPDASDADVTLTATAQVRGHSASRDFQVRIAQAPTAQDRAQRDLDAVTIANADDIRGNIHLPEVGSLEGSELSWKSSDEQVISTSAVGAEAPGKVTRSAAGDVEIELEVTATYNGAEVSRTILVTVRQSVEMAPTTDYLFTHFINTEGKPSDEQIYFATSRDGISYQDTREDGDPALGLDADQGDGGVRDPWLVRSGEGDRFFLIATDLNIHLRGGWGEAKATETGSTKLVIWESTDLVNWSEPRLPDVAGKIPNAGMAWAPEAFWDEKTGQYYVYWATRADGNTEYGDSVDVYLSKTRDFIHFSDPIKWIDREHSIIDTTMIQVGDWYYRASADGQITIERSKNIEAVTAAPQPATSGSDDEWVLVGTLQNILNGSGDCAGGTNYTGACLEGPEFFKFNDDDAGDADELWGLIADQYAMGRGYAGFTSTDLSSTDAAVWEHIDMDFGGLKKRHGGVLPITAEEYARVMQAYAGVEPNPLEGVTVTSDLRCLADNVTQVVRVSNGEDVEVSATIDSPWGTREITSVEPGRIGSQAIAARSNSVDETATQVVIESGQDTATIEVTNSSLTC